MYLDISYSHIQGPVLQQIMALPHVIELNLSGCRLHNNYEACQLLAQQEQWGRLSLQNMGLTDGDISALRGCESITTLDIAGNPGVTDGAISALLGPSTLRVENLRAEGTGISDEHLHHFHEVMTKRRNDWQAERMKSRL